jgi:hypothetical protein
LNLRRTRKPEAQPLQERRHQRERSDA